MLCAYTVLGLSVCVCVAGYLRLSVSLGLAVCLFSVYSQSCVSAGASQHRFANCTFLFTLALHGCDRSVGYCSGTRFTKYPTRLSYDSANVTIDLQLTSN